MSRRRGAERPAARRTAEPRRAPVPEAGRGLSAWIKPIDGVILLAGGFLAARVDFDHVTLVDVIYLASIAMWFVFLLVRLYLIRRNRRNGA